MNSLELPDTLLPRFGIAFLPPRLGVQVYDETAPFAWVLRYFCLLSSSSLLEEVVSEPVEHLRLLGLVVVPVWRLKYLLLGGRAFPRWSPRLRLWALQLSYEDLAQRERGFDPGWGGRRGLKDPMALRLRLIECLVRKFAIWKSWVGSHSLFRHFFRGLFLRKYLLLGFLVNFLQNCFHFNRFYGFWIRLCLFEQLRLSLMSFLLARSWNYINRSPLLALTCSITLLFLAPFLLYRRLLCGCLLDCWS